MTTNDDQLLDYLYGEMTAEERQPFEAAARDPQGQPRPGRLRRLLRLRQLPELRRGRLPAALRLRLERLTGPLPLPV